MRDVAGLAGEVCDYVCAPAQVKGGAGGVLEPRPASEVDVVKL